MPTIYGTDLTEGALSETVFHDVAVRGPGRLIFRKGLVPMVMSTITPVSPVQTVSADRAVGAGTL